MSPHLSQFWKGEISPWLSCKVAHLCPHDTKMICQLIKSLRGGINLNVHFCMMGRGRIQVANILCSFLPVSVNFFDGCGKEIGFS